MPAPGFRTFAGGAPRTYALALLAVTAVALWLVWPAFAPGRIINLDAPRHLLRSEVMARQFLPSGHVDGWSPYWYLGAQLFLFQSYGYFFLIGASAWLLHGLASIEDVFKFWYVLPIVALPAATAWMARRLGVSRWGAIAAALASLMFSSPLGYGVQGVFGIGLLLQGAGVVGFALVWPAVLHALLDRNRSPWPVALMVAALVLVHFITGAYTLAAAGCVAAGLALKDGSPWPLLRYGLVAVAALLLAGHALFPSLELHDLSGAVVGWGVDRSRLDRFVDGRLFGARSVALAALAAALWSLRFGGRPLAVTALLLFGTAVAGGANEQGWEPQFLERILEILVRPRALPYAALLQALFAGVAVDAFARLGARVVAWGGRPRVTTAFSVVATLLLLWCGGGAIRAQRHFVATEATLKGRGHATYVQLVKWLRRNVDRPAVVAVPRTLFPQSVLGARSVISLLNLDTGLYTLGGDQAELTKTPWRTGRIDLERLDENPRRSAATLRAAGVSHLILSRHKLRERLAGSKDFELVFEYETVPTRPRGRGHHHAAVSVAVYRVRGGGTWLHGPGVKVLARRPRPERIVWAVQVRPVERTGPAVAAVNWHPNWKAWVDGVAVETRCSAARRVSFALPPGARRVQLEFVRSTREKGYNALSATALLLVGVLWRRDSRRRRGREVGDAQRT